MDWIGWDLIGFDWIGILRNQSETIGMIGNAVCEIPHPSTPPDRWNQRHHRLVIIGNLKGLLWGTGPGDWPPSGSRDASGMGAPAPAPLLRPGGAGWPNGAAAIRLNSNQRQWIGF